MHSKHHPNAPHTMAATYTPHYTRPHLSTHHRPTWSETQAAMLLSLRDISNPPRKIPDAEVRGFDEDSQIHARWTDPDLVSALSRLQESIPSNDKLSFRYGGRDVTAATWVMVYQTTRRGTTELRNVLWFHEYDDLDVEVGELADVKWGFKKEEEEMDVVVKKEEEVDVDVKVKMEDVGMDG